MPPVPLLKVNSAFSFERDSARAAIVASDGGVGAGVESAAGVAIGAGVAAAVVAVAWVSCGL